MAGKIQRAVKKQEKAGENASLQAVSGKGVNAMVNSILDSDGYRKRFNEVLGKRAPQFVSSIVSMVNADDKLQEAFYNSPLSVIQAALKAATLDLPIDKSMGYAYIVPFRNKGKMEATFVMGYRGMIQLAYRTGAYKTINVVALKEGELKNFNRLTEEIEIGFIEDADERDKRETIGYVGYFKLVNGTEKTIFHTKKEIDSHEEKHRKGKYKNPIWDENYDAMAAKTVLRELLGKWGMMSVDYNQADTSTILAAETIARGEFDDEEEPVIDGKEQAVIDADYTVQEQNENPVTMEKSNELTEEEKAEIEAMEAAEAEQEMMAGVEE